MAPGVFGIDPPWSRSVYRRSGAGVRLLWPHHALPGKRLRGERHCGPETASNRPRATCIFPIRACPKTTSARPVLGSSNQNAARGAGSPNTRGAFERPYLNGDGRALPCPSAESSGAPPRRAAPCVESAHTAPLGTSAPLFLRRLRREYRLPIGARRRHLRRFRRLRSLGRGRRGRLRLAGGTAVPAIPPV